MDALLPTFLAALLAEFGDKTQLLAIVLALRFPRREGAVLAGIAVAALANSLIAAGAGQLIHQMINFRAITLMIAVALLSAGVGSLMRQRRPDTADSWKLGAFGTSAVSFGILAFGDTTQFLTMTLAARADSLLLAAAGATAGTVAGAAVAVALADRFEKSLPLRPLRHGIAGLFLLIGFVTAIGALRLI
ncbi:TMEM165/GDT1 family protein [Flavisphingomonas formosensis]|uniref:TMEM165/GDT1 family protein n=1 Tax=Flavisphingomonas formosensis TaxID=861534 RepID=UPI0012F9D91B|nr:TMEM165/GDT1 family protein [Sphingomonas formosensis]